jgi:hypothetical protein
VGTKSNGSSGQLLISHLATWQQTAVVIRGTLAAQLIKFSMKFLR